MSLTITIGRTEGGLFRAEVSENPGLIIENTELSKVVEELKQRLDMIRVAPDGQVLLDARKTVRDTDDVAARLEVERTALRNEELDELIERYPVPVEWGDEPGWSDAL